jgi:MobA/MobL family
VANYHLSVHPNVSRGKGQSLVRTAAYNARARLSDERTGKAWDYRRYGAVLFEGIYAAKAPDWARDLERLVNGIERAEKRTDAQLAMNIDIALPHEQTLEQNRRLLQDFVRDEFMRK